MPRPLLVALALATVGAPPASPADAPELSLFLIGDAGSPAPGGEPVLRALGRELARDPARSLVVFLGDNVYPAGLPPAGDAARPEMERRLDTQVAAVKDAGARGVFLPGNHDWAAGKPGGWEAVRRQGRRIDERGAPLVEVLPKDGCPGPEVVDAGERLRLVVLDTEWWLHGGPRPRDPDSPCRADSEGEVLVELERALQTAGPRTVVVVGHHPLASGGPHGGHFTFRQHVFPLTDVKKGLWLPLPIVGSLYPIVRGAGVSREDMANPVNAHLREGLERAFRTRPPLVYAAGHEHTLQVFDGPGARHVLVSGAGFYGHTSPAKRIEGTRYASSRSGFMRIDLEGSGRARLSVLEVTKTGASAERYSVDLD